jgi:hypothetical protein
VNRKYALTWEEALNVMEPYGDGPLVVCRLCGFVVNIKMARLHVIERHPAVPVGFGFKCAYCGRMEASANDLIDRCRDRDKCYILWYKRKLSDAGSAVEAELLKAELRLRLRALKQALEEGDAEEAARIADRLLREVVGR